MILQRQQCELVSKPPEGKDSLLLTGQKNIICALVGVMYILNSDDYLDIQADIIGPGMIYAYRL
jgi:hypothetical protein